MKISVQKTGKLAFAATTPSGHTVMMDSSAELGGENKGPRPMEMLLMGAGGCSAIDVITILEKGRQQIKDCQIEIEAERASEDPKVFTKIHLHFILSGAGLDEKKVQRALQLSAEKYCSASIMLSKTAELSHDYEIIET